MVAYDGSALGAFDWRTAIAPLESRLYTGLTRTALTEAEARYGPYALGTLLGMFAFVLLIGRKVLR